MRDRECVSCIKRKTPYCPTSMECMATDDMPYYQNRMMLLKENQELKCELELYENGVYFSSEVDEKDKQIDKLKKKYENAVADYEKTRFEKEQLKKQLEEHKNTYIKKVNNFLAENVEPDPEDLYMAELEQRAMDCELMEMQQKEFINYLEDEIKNIQITWGNQLTENGYIDIAMTVRAYQIILQKYKEITRGK